nr:nuclear receptor coactivator 7-like [Danio rerio]|eukprot:XP_005174588.3 nuclear receptor coactivator 7-like [Danio rerio]
MVEPKDTLNSIALHFNITPNKLVHLNRLYSHSVVPGQKLFVPDEDEAKCVSQVSDCSKHLAASESTEIKDGEYSSRPGRPVCRETSPLSEDESPATVKFIKMSCKYFTDGMVRTRRHHRSSWIPKPMGRPKIRAGSRPKLRIVPRIRVGFGMNCLRSQVI